MVLAVGDSLDLLEVCPQGLGLAGELAKRVTAEGGAALVIDYGHDQPYADSLQAIKDHSFVPVLSQPGLADLSAHVDFSAIKYVCIYASCPCRFDSACFWLGSLVEVHTMTWFSLMMHIKPLSLSAHSQCRD